MFQKIVDQIDKLVKPEAVRDIQSLEKFRANQDNLQKEFEEAFENNTGYTKEQLVNDLTSNFRTTFQQRSFRLRFSDYVGKPKAVSRYVRLEILTQLIYIIFMVTFGILALTALNIGAYFLVVQPITLKVIIGLTSFLSISSIVNVIYKAARISRYPNVYGIMFGFRLSKVRVHRAIFTFIKRDQPNELGNYAPSYYNWSYDSDKGFVAKDQKALIRHEKIKDELSDLTYGSNEHFIMTIHLLLLNHDIETFKKLNEEYDTAKIALEEGVDI